MNNASLPWPRFWRLGIIALGVLILCSCRATETPGPRTDLSGIRSDGYATLPPQAMAGGAEISPPVAAMPAPGPMQGGLGGTGVSPALRQSTGKMPVPPGAMPASYEAQGDCPAGQPSGAAPPPENSMIQPGPGVDGPGPGVLGQPSLPAAQPSGAWSPPGIETPWPKSEYVRDGGHVGAPLTVNRQGQVRGLQMEDTVAQYETLDGESHVQPSNPVYLYAPRFGAVRQVSNLEDGVQIDRLRSLHEPVKLAAPTIRTPVATGQQDLQVGDDIGLQPASIFHAKQGYGAVSISVGPHSFQDRYKAFENLSVIRLGAIKESESAWVARGSDAAAVWTDKQAVQILLEHRAAVVDSTVEKLGTVYTNDLPPTPRLRIVKLASTSDAKPGEKVDFTIRFDNLGRQAIGSVVILDSLSTRLEYVPASAQCSLEARFSTQPNEGESLVMRCELLNPLKPGEGGLIRFQCRVR